MTKAKATTKHTAAPWEAKPDPQGNGTLIVGPGKHGIIARMIRSYDFMEPEQERNAALIAAAPELLSACKMLLAWADRECMPQGGKNDAPWEVLEFAVAKAEGTK